MTLLTLTACTSDLTSNQRWDTRQPQGASSSQTPQQLATPGEYNQDLSAGKGPYAEGGLAEKTATQANVPPVKVAILLPLSGASQDMGQAMLKAAQLALFDLGADTFQLIPKDTAGTSVGATQAAQEAIHDGTELILGPLFSHSVRAVRPIAKRANVNVVAFSTDWSQAGDHVYLTGFMPFNQVGHTIEYAAKQGLKNVALITKGDAYGQAVEKSFLTSAAQQSVQVAQILRTSPSGLAYNDIQNLRNSRPDGVMIAVGGQDAVKISRQLHEAGLTSLMVRRLGTGLWDDAALAREPYMDGAWFSAPSPTARTAFERNYQDLYGMAPPRLATLAYDATALAAVLGKMGTIGQDGIYRPAYRTQNLNSPSGFAGIDGVFRFTQRGLIERRLSVLEFRNGTIVQVEAADTRF